MLTIFVDSIFSNYIPTVIIGMFVVLTFSNFINGHCIVSNTPKPIDIKEEVKQETKEEVKANVQELSLLGKVLAPLKSSPTANQ